MEKRTKLWLAAAALGTAYWVVRSKSVQAERALPPSGRFMEVEGVRLHYLDRGTGPVVVLLHGNAMLAQDFELSGLIDKLVRAGHRVIAFDRPGYGYSTRPRARLWTADHQARLLLQALQRLEVEQAVLLGHSWGTLVALAMALRDPDAIRGLVLASGYYYPTLRLDTALQSGPAIPLLGDAMRYTVSPLLAWLLWPVMVWRMFSPSAVPATFRRLPKWMCLRPGSMRASAAEAAMMIPTAASMNAGYAGLEMPVALVAGSGDRMVDADFHSGRLHRELLQSELNMVEGAGHMLQHVAQDELLAAVQKVVAQRPGLDTPRPAQAGMAQPHV